MKEFVTQEIKKYVQSAYPKDIDELMDIVNKIDPNNQIEGILKDDLIHLFGSETERFLEEVKDETGTFYFG